MNLRFQIGVSLAGESPGFVGRHHRLPDRDWNALHPLQGRLQPEEVFFLPKNQQRLKVGAECS